MRQLNENQLKYFADVFNNVGMVFFASMVIPVFTQNVRNINTKQVILGFGYAAVCWFLGFITLNERKEKI